MFKQIFFNLCIAEIHQIFDLLIRGLIEILILSNFYFCFKVLIIFERKTFLIIERARYYSICLKCAV